MDESYFQPPLSPEARRTRIMHHMVQQVIGDIDYTGTNRDDEVWWQLHTIQEENGLPDGVTADHLYNLYVSNYGGTHE